jgi:2-deoxy-D-gluconate 3-dehydrogenase
VTDPSAKTIRELLTLDGRRAIVTGGAMGIGFAIARRLAEAGASMTIADVDEQAAARAVDRLRREGWSADAVQVDVRISAAVERMIEAAATTDGIDILVNNAGIYPARPVQQMTEDEWDRVLGVNLKGTFLCSRAAAERMIAQGRGGVIINMASVNAVHPSYVGLAHYDASKGGVLSFTRSHALELAPHGIRVVAIAPGAVSSEGAQASIAAMTTPDRDQDQITRAYLAKVPLGRIGEPDDIARVALFLASDAAAYITGSVVFVEGGRLLS